MTLSESQEFSWTTYAYFAIIIIVCYCFLALCEKASVSCIAVVLVVAYLASLVLTHVLLFGVVHYCEPGDLSTVWSRSIPFVAVDLFAHTNMLYRGQKEVISFEDRHGWLCQYHRLSRNCCS
jgi:hypothetical protein